MTSLQCVIKISPYRHPPIPGKLCHTTGFYVPYSFRTVVWILVLHHAKKKNWISESALRWNILFFILIQEA